VVTERIRSVRDLVVYKKAFDAAMSIFDISKAFPKEEKYSLTDQIRRSSRSVCTNLSEAWRKRRYKAVFVNKLSDSGQEAAETQTWLEFSLACNYIDDQIYEKLHDEY
jgi:four helix bundle protein